MTKLTTLLFEIYSRLNKQSCRRFTVFQSTVLSAGNNRGHVKNLFRHN